MAQALLQTTQVIHLASGWHLISIQVETSYTPARFKVTMADPESFAAVWEYHPPRNPSLPAQWNVFQAFASSEFPSDVAAIVAGKGYWVKASQNTTLTLIGPRCDGAVGLLAGWNPVACPGIDLAVSKWLDLTSLFSTNLTRIQQIWTHDNSSKQSTGYDLTAIPGLLDLSQIGLGQGDWNYAAEPVSTEPGPYVVLPNDADASLLEPEVDFVLPPFRAITDLSHDSGPLVRKIRPDSEDVSLDHNGNGIFESAFTQTDLKFDIGADRKVFTIGNYGIGFANWVLSNSVPWLLTAIADERINQGNLERPKTASGVVFTEFDSIPPYADASGLIPGPQTGTITLMDGCYDESSTGIVPSSQSIFSTETSFADRQIFSPPESGILNRVTTENPRPEATLFKVEISIRYKNTLIYEDSNLKCLNPQLL